MLLSTPSLIRPDYNTIYTNLYRVLLSQSRDIAMPSKYSLHTTLITSTFTRTICNHLTIALDLTSQ